MTNRQNKLFVMIAFLFFGLRGHADIINPIINKRIELTFSGSLPNFNISTDGKYLALIKNTGIEIIDSDTGVIKKIIHLKNEYEFGSRIKFSPDNKYLVYFDSNSLFLYNLDENRLILKRGGQKNFSPNFNYKSKELFVLNSTDSNKVDAVDVKSGNVKISINAPQDPKFVLSTPYGYLVVIGRSIGMLEPSPPDPSDNVFVINASTNTILYRFKTIDPFSVQISPQSKFIIFKPTYNIFRLLDLETEEIVQEVEAKLYENAYLSKDERYMVSTDFNTATVRDFLTKGVINTFSIDHADKLLDSKLIGHFLILVTKEGYFRIHNILTGETIVQFKDETLYQEPEDGNSIPFPDFLIRRYSYRYLRTNTDENRISYFTSIYEKSGFIRIFDTKDHGGS